MNGKDALTLFTLAVTVILPTALPRRWLVRGMVLWIFSPLMLFVVVAISETLGTSKQDKPISLLFNGLMLVSAFVTVPWLLFCLLGFGVGLGIRRLLRGPSTDPAAGQVAAQPADSADSGLDPVALPALPPPNARRSIPEQVGFPATPGWRPLHIGVSNDSTVVGGLPIWAHRWRPAAVPPLRLPHPAHPDQRHQFEVVEIGDPVRPVRFAAGELSNGVWGIYVSTDLAAEEREGSALWRSKTSPDGTIRVDTDCQEWGTSQWVAAPRVVDLSRGSVVLNLWNAPWDANVTFEGEREVRLCLRRYGFVGVTVVVLNLASQTYCIVAEPGREGPRTPGPLDEVASAIEDVFQLGYQAEQGAAAPALRRRVGVAWRAGGLIALGAAVVIVAVGYVAAKRPEVRSRAVTPLARVPNLDGLTRSPIAAPPQAPATPP